MTPWNEYEKIEHTGDGSKDYYDGAMRNLADGDREMRTSRLSSFWGGRYDHVAVAESEAMTFNMIRIRNAVRSFLRVHGLPADARVDLANIGQQAHGRCSFGDQEKWERPLILLDKAIYTSCATYNEALDVYCGIGLHEASHANHTRLLFELQKSGELEGLLAIFAGLFEDERIEELARKESPGFAPYIQAAKRALFEKKEFGVAMAGWEDAVDMDKLTMLIFAFLRCPHLVKEQHTKFTLVDDSCPWEDLRKMFKEIPRTELQVKKDSSALYAYYLTKKKLYRDAADQLGEDTKSGEGAPENIDRIEQQAKASEQDRRATRDFHHIDKDEEKRIQHSRIEGLGAEELADELLQEAGGVLDKKLDKLDEGVQDAKRKRKRIESSREGRFAAIDLEEMMKRANTVTDALDAGESRRLFSAEEQRLEIGEEWKWKYSSLERKDIVTHPKPNSDQYEKFRESVHDEISRMRKVFQLRLGTRVIKETERKSGKLHRRRLARCKSTNRLFYHKTEKTDRGLALCLLLDESGSMGSPNIGDTRKATITLQIAVLLAEALKKVPGIELEIYSYSSFGYENTGSLLKYLYGKQNPNPQSIAAYGDGGENYDHKAIETSVKLFKKNTTNKNRLMIMVSDGAPAGVEYGGHSAILATKRAAAEAEREGVPIIHVAIEAYRAEEMFKNSLKFTDLSDLTNQMRRLVTKIVKRVSE